MKKTGVYNVTGADIYGMCDRDRERDRERERERERERGREEEGERAAACLLGVSWYLVHTIIRDSDCLSA